MKNILRFTLKRIDMLQLIAMFIRAGAIYPAAITLVLLMGGVGFSFKSLMVSYYGYVSSVSQVAAESPRHVNQNLCVASKEQPMPVIDNALPPRSVCEKWETRSVLIEEAAEESADILIKVYAFLVFVSIAIELGVIIFRAKVFAENDSDETAPAVRKM